ncbi:endopeptidase [Salmonella enterica subsp. enterica serovar Sandiego]|uniref:lysis protein n=1 Tax=Salmonella enterica TaxID=28901 RepID=UPI0008FCB2AE|nr:lysis protein [Salmonella enterica]EAA8398287.1 lysis protein [Salmonella enterica subsp. enterica serovar Oranienburg]ECI0119938.1 lysis protein [Salmonella enterica subsp. enterica serovar Abaetetuba]EHD9044192.1 lysis protein [Salmonella enterica subsp. enterica serovar Carrau]EAN3289295.1 lysis protein [Salmonella enterica subsp. enterica serovar Oranienburg]EAR0432349.1 lysis protein [Salmonella enterica subsp. enterica serovar Oranienburg]
MNRATLAFIVFMVAAVAVLGFTADHWHSRYTRAEKARRKAVALASARQRTIDDMTLRQRQNAALDAKYTQELADAHAESEKLRADLTAGRRRLQLHAVCMPAATRDTTATGATDAATARLTPDAERDYQRLRTEARAVTAQVKGLQQYINEQCH